MPHQRVTVDLPTNPKRADQQWDATHRRHVLICRFGASPGEPQPSMAATNKCLAQSNKTRTGPKLPTSDRQRGAIPLAPAKLARPVAGSALPVFTALWRREVETGTVMKRCAQCHGKLGLGVRFRNVWNGRWWVHVRYCSTHCEALHELERYNAAPNVGRHIIARSSPQKLTEPILPAMRHFDRGCSHRATPTFAATNKRLAQRNKSRTRAETTLRA